MFINQLTPDQSTKTQERSSSGSWLYVFVGLLFWPLGLYWLITSKRLSKTQKLGIAGGFVCVSLLLNVPLFLRRHREEYQDWKQASEINTVQSLEGYLVKYNFAWFGTEAHNRLDDFGWQTATSINSIKSYRVYCEVFAKGKYVSQAKSKLESLRVDDALYLVAANAATDTSLRGFLREYPGHIKESEAKTLLEKMTVEGEITDLIAKKTIEAQVLGHHESTTVKLRVRRRIPWPVKVRITAASYFVCDDQTGWNMIATCDWHFQLTEDEWQVVSLPAAFAYAKAAKPIPEGGDNVAIQRSPHQVVLVRLLQELENARAGASVRQAAIWIVTDDRDFLDLGDLVEVQVGNDGRREYLYGPDLHSGSRAIRENDAAHAMKICADAGIDITHKKIWRDKVQILSHAQSIPVKKWLEEKQ